MSGRIVILNGAPRSGKTSIARAMQDTLPGHWINLGVDSQSRSLPEALKPGIGLRPGGERPDLEPMVMALYLALYDSIADYASEGFDVVADLGHHDGHSVPLGILPACARRLAGQDSLFVGVHCPIDIIMERRNADPQGGYYVADKGVPDPVQRWQDRVHVPGIYDLTVDTACMTPDQCAQAIFEVLADPPLVRAFATLARSSGRS